MKISGKEVIKGMTLEEAIRHYEESEKINKELAENCVSAMAKNHNIENAEKCRQMIEWLSELQERRKADSEIPFGDSYSFTELDSIINAYEVHGGYHKKVVELLKELAERRKQPEIIRCGECAHSNKEYSGEMWCGICNGFGIDENSFCSFAERRTDADD